MGNPLARLMVTAGALLGLALPAARADILDLQEQMESAYHARDAGQLQEIRGQLLALTGDALPAEAARGAYLAAYARFRQALLAEAIPAEARDHLDACISELKTLVARHPEDAEALALLGSCYGISTRYYPLALASRGLKARAHMTAARSLAPDNPWVMLQDGLADYATPALFGGDASRAVAKVERAAGRFDEEARAGSRMAGWASVEAWLQLARLYRETGQPAKAEQALARAEQARPGAMPVRLASSR